MKVGVCFFLKYGTSNNIEIFFIVFLKIAAAFFPALSVVWNTTLIATLRIELSDIDFLGLLQPWNSLNQTYVPATVHFDNGFTRKTLSNVGFKQKGSGCKKHQKHCWNVKFDEFVNGQDLKGYKLSKIFCCTQPPDGVTCR